MMHLRSKLPGPLERNMSWFLDVCVTGFQRVSQLQSLNIILGIDVERAEEKLINDAW